ncbi:MAG TPA: hypothetical protein VK497_01065 [Candidatus Saccharimonadales bacterium]|nr:hypothetical protein [Candidatus Saccharimonadales bacterium]
MENKQNTHKNSSLLSDKKKLMLIAGAGVLVLIAIVSIFFLTKPERSVASFCRVAKEQKGSFDPDTGMEQLLSSVKKMDDVAPSEIHSDTSLIIKGYETIINDPSKATSTELGISGSQVRVSDYITKNCPDYY